MGIPGLTTYIKDNSQFYLKNYNLHNTYLIIDGRNISYQIYRYYVKCNCVFGGDYDNYSEYVLKFFDQLLKCDITPLVIFDGVMEQKKLRTVIKRCKEKTKQALEFNVHSNTKHFPLFTQHIFMSIVKQKNIRYIQDLMEADDSIATLAMILNCPVLSLDSDFYIYDISYIPFDTLCTDISKNSTGDSYIKCKIYKMEYLVQHFDGLDKSLIPLFATLLGNDYMDCRVFSDFFCQLKLTRMSRTQRIERILTWLCYYNLDNAVTNILSKLTIPIRQKALDLIVTNINHYINLSNRILIAFGFSKDYIAQISTLYLKRKFVFNKDIKTLTNINSNIDNKYDHNNDEEEEDTNINIINNLPQWFLKKYQTARLPSYFMNLIIYRLYIPYAQIEDYTCPPVIECSLELLRIIFGFLKSLMNNEIHYMSCLIRITYKYDIQTKKLKSINSIKYGKNNINIYKLHSLHDLQETTLIFRKELFNYIMNITDDVNCINELPQEWMLYVICMKYWIKKQENPISHRCYLYSLFICMLFNIIDSKIGKYRIMNTFHSKYQKKIDTIVEERKKNEHIACNVLINNTIIKDYNEIDYNDCLLAASFFISHFKMNHKLYTNPKKFDRYIVHKFSEFQYCLTFIMDLNALLGYPYLETKIENVYNGTLLYNLCSNFKTCSDIGKYINNTFCMSPSLLKLFNTFLLKIEPIFSSVLQN